MALKKNTAVTGFPFSLVSATDGSDITTGTPVGYYTIDGATQTAIADVTPVHEGNGQWTVDLTAAEMNGDVVGLVFTHASAVTATFTITTEVKLVNDLVDFNPATDTVGTVTTLTGHTAQTGDSFSLANGAAGFVAIDTVVDAMKVVTDQFAFTVPNLVDRNKLAVSGDTGSADNLELQYDGTGLVGDTFPSSQSQLSGLANVGSAVNKPAISYTLTTGIQSANLFSDTAALDNLLHEHTDTAGAMDLYYEFQIGAGTASSVQVTGYVSGINDALSVYGYDWNASQWVQVGTFNGTNSTANRVESYDLFVGMVGSGADRGKVRVRFAAASGLTTATLAVDQIFTSFNLGSEGYINGAVWYDEAASNVNTVPGTDGVAGNEISTEAAVESLLTSTGLHKVNVAPGSTYTLASTHNNRIINGHGAALVLGGQDCNETHFMHMSVSGTGTAASEMEFHDCELSTASVQKAHFYDCTFNEVVTLSIAGDYHVINSQSGVAGAGSPTFAKTAGQAVTVEFRRWSGGVTFSGLELGDTLTISGELGTLDLGSPVGAVSIEVRGSYKAITNIGSAVVNLAGAFLAGDIASTLVDTSTNIPAQVTAIPNDILTTALAEVYAADGVAPTVQQALMLIQQTIGDFAISSTTMTVKKLDGSTTAATYTLDDAANPTSRTRTT